MTIGDIHIHAAPGMDTVAIGREVERRLRELLRPSRDGLHDGGLA